MKKIMFMIESMVVGGAEKVLIDLVNNLDKEKYEITIISMFKYSIYDGYNHNFKDLFNENINVKYLIDNSNKLHYRIFNILNNRLPKSHIYKLFIKEKYDIEVAFYEGAPTEFLSYSTNKDSKKIAWLHTDSNNAFGHFDKNQIEKIKGIYEKYDDIVCVSQSVGESFRRIININKNPIVKYNTLDFNKIVYESTYDIDEVKEQETLVFITVGRLIPIKGYDRLLKVVKMLKAEGYNFKLWMIGDGSERSNLENFVNENNLNDLVKFLGFQDNPYKYMSKADVFVCSSLAEGFSTVATESLILNTPIITTDCAGMKELFGDYECGIITENSIDGLYNGIKAILDDNSLIEKFKLNEKKRSSFFLTENRVKDIEKVLN